MRPAIGAILQLRYNEDSPWDYTGIVTRHDQTNEDRFYVEWHKWDDIIAREDNESLSGWEYGFDPSKLRVIETRQPNQWWPLSGSREASIHAEYVFNSKQRPDLLSMIYEGGTVLCADKRGYIAVLVTTDANIVGLMDEISSGSGDFTGAIITSLVGLMHHYIIINDPDSEEDIFDTIDTEIVEWVRAQGE